MEDEEIVVAEKDFVHPIVENSLVVDIKSNEKVVVDCEDVSEFDFFFRRFMRSEKSVMRNNSLHIASL